jgi:hypothetical protein
MKFDLRVFDADPRVVAALAETFGGVDSVRIIAVDAMLYFKPPNGLDVLYLPLAAAEKFGSKPLIHKSQVFHISPLDQQAGLPPFVVSGTCLAADDSRGPIPEMRILLTAVFDAIRAFNQQGDTQLATIGFWAYNLLAGITPLQLKGILTELVPELM